MTPRTCGWAFRLTSLGCLASLWLTGGCATTAFGPAIAHYADNTAVTNAAARHTSASPYYRFNSILLSDLDDAINSTDARTQREMAAAILRRANALSQSSTTNEIERMPTRTRKELVRATRPPSGSDGPGESEAIVPAVQQEETRMRFTSGTVLPAVTEGAPADVVAMQLQFSDLASTALDNDLREVNQLPLTELQSKLRTIREGVEDLPDDRGRSKRKILYAWATSMTANGIAKEESKLPKKCRDKAEKTFRRVAIWRPTDSAKDPLINRFAPIMAVEWPVTRSYDDNIDRIGAVELSSRGRHIEVRIEPSAPTVYSYATVAKIHGERLRQLNYVWWYPERPQMSPGDPVAGHIDGAMLRITLNAKDEPVFVESSLNCGCSHEVFVADRIESAARKVFGAPLAGKRFVVEKTVPGKHDVVVIDTFDPRHGRARPLILSAAGYHEVYQVRFDAPESIDALEVVEDASYQLANYDTLDALPLGDGIASMFGPDGLVHYAGRHEGFLLAPTGMLSAGQPRKRGTQRVRWDDYLHDDPHLLEKTLRIPPLD